MKFLANLARNKGDPKILKTGPSSVGAADRLAKSLGWFSIGLGLVQLIAPERITRALGMQGMEPLMRAYGAREIGTGVVTLSPDKRAGLWMRVAGDLLDIATLAPALHWSNPKRNNAKAAMAVVVGVTAIDVISAIALGARHREGSGRLRHFSNRSGFPKGLATARGSAKDFKPNGHHRGPEVAETRVGSSRMGS
jgi:hypothetical protein